MYKYCFSPSCKIPKKPTKPVTKPVVKRRLTYTKKPVETPKKEIITVIPKRKIRKTRIVHRRPKIVTKENVTTRIKPGKIETETYNETWICDDNGVCRLVRKQENQDGKNVEAFTPLVSPYDVKLNSLAIGLDGHTYSAISKDGIRKWSRCRSTDTEGIC
jgi:hypothetical protein